MRATIRSKARQRGVVMLITLIALVLLLLAGAAMMRSADTSTVLAGNIGFRRDLGNKAELGFIAARKLLVSGYLNTDTARSSDQAGYNYFATVLETNADGVPKALASGTEFTNKGMTPANDISDDTRSVTVRYVIDRLCVSGTSVFTTSNCEVTAASATDKGGSNWLRKADAESRPVYRISVRVSAPRNTQSFYQSTFAL